jgi:hypothetical protein
MRGSLNPSSRLQPRKDSARVTQAGRPGAQALPLAVPCGGLEGGWGETGALLAVRVHPASEIFGQRFVCVSARVFGAMSILFVDKPSSVWWAPSNQSKT